MYFSVNAELKCLFPGCKLGEASEFLVQQDAQIDPGSNSERSGRVLRGVQLWAQWPSGELCGDALSGHQQGLHGGRPEEE